MIKIYTDFNERSEDGCCWNLVYQNQPVHEGLLKKGDVVILFQDDDDFEVEATVDFRFFKQMNRAMWVATPNWSTKMSVLKQHANIGGRL